VKYITPIYWDTCVFLAFFKGEKNDPAITDGIENVVRKVDANEAYLITSVITRVELLERSIEDEKSRRRMVDFFKQDNVKVVELGIKIADMAYEIRDHYWPEIDIGTADYIHLASAIAHKVDVLQTLDGSGRKSKGKMLTIPQPIAGKYEINIQVPFAAQANLLSLLEYERTQDTEKGGDNSLAVAALAPAET